MIRYIWLLFVLCSCSLKNGSKVEIECEDKYKEELSKKHCFSCHGLRKDLTAVKFEYLIDSVGRKNLTKLISDTTTIPEHKILKLSSEEVECIVQFLEDSPWIVIDY